MIESRTIYIVITLVLYYTILYYPILYVLIGLDREIDLSKQSGNRRIEDERM